MLNLVYIKISAIVLSYFSYDLISNHVNELHHIHKIGCEKENLLMYKIGKNYK